MLILLMGIFMFWMNENTLNIHLDQMSKTQLYTSQYESAQSVQLDLEDILVYKQVQPYFNNAQAQLDRLILRASSPIEVKQAKQVNVLIARHQWKTAIQAIVHYKSMIHNQLVFTMNAMMADIRIEKATALYSMAFDILLTLLFVYFMINAEREQVKQAKHALLQTESRLTAAVMNLPVILFTLNRVGIFTMAMGKRLTDLNVNSRPVIGESVFELYKHRPEILEHIQKAVRLTTEDHAFSEEIKVDNQTFEISYVALGVDDPSASSFTGIALDITDHKKMEDELRLANVAFETSDAMTITDKNGNILRVNQAFTKVTGYEQHEVIGKNPSVLQSGLHDKIYYTNMWNSLLQYGKWEGEIWNKRKAGEIYPEWLMIRGVQDETGSTVNYIATFYDLTEKKILEANVERLSYYDLLTGLANRRLLLEQLKLAIENIETTGNFGALVFIELDRFKYLNDARGHEMGDVLLNLVARKLEEVIPSHAIAARLGGDEFVVLLPVVREGTDNAEQIFKRETQSIHNELTGNYLVGEVMHALTVSIGATMFSCDKSHDEVLKEADMAMHAAKEQGRNTIVYYEQELMIAAENRFHLEEDLYYALDRNELVLFYQPQMDQKGNLKGVESLLRWNHRKKGLIGPDRFIPIAEDSGLIVPIGAWVLRQSCLLLRRLQEAGLRINVSVNVSPRQFHESDFVEMVSEIVADTGIDPYYLMLEVTEGVLIDYAENTIEKMHRLSRLGIHFSIDDFGTGYSSLAYLKSLPLNELKIDRSFIIDMMSTPSTTMIVETIIAMAKHLGLSVIAEGVESEEQVKFLTERGCDHFQGYYFHPPISYEKLSNLLEISHVNY